MANYIHASKTTFINQIVKHLTKVYPGKFNKIVVFGDSVDETVKQPESLDIAIDFTDPTDNGNYELLGAILSYMGEIVTEGDCTLVPICNNVKQQYLDLIDKGVIVYGKT